MLLGPLPSVQGQELVQEPPGDPSAREPRLLPSEPPLVLLGPLPSAQGQQLSGPVPSLRECIPCGRPNA